MPAGAYSHFHADGRPYQTELARPHDLVTAAGRTIPCAAEHVVLSEAGHLLSCRLAQPIAIAGIGLQADHGVSFYPGGQLQAGTISRPLAALSALFPAGTSLSWHVDGALAGGWLRTAMEVAGFLIQYDFAVHPTGRLSRFQLSRERTISGHRFPAGSELWLRSDGSLLRAQYDADSGFLPHGEEWRDIRYLRFDCAGRVTDSRVEHWQDSIPEPP